MHRLFRVLCFHRHFSSQIDSSEFRTISFWLTQSTGRMNGSRLEIRRIYFFSFTFKTIELINDRFLLETKITPKIHSSAGQKRDSHQLSVIPFVSEKKEKELAWNSERKGKNEQERRRIKIRSGKNCGNSSSDTKPQNYCCRYYEEERIATNLFCVRSKISFLQIRCAMMADVTFCVCFHKVTFCRYLNLISASNWCRCIRTHTNTASFVFRIFR